jgi:exodeoxyribonuclease V alpha subunit
MIDIDSKLYSLSLSKFRSSFHLRKYMIDYINEKGLDKIKNHAYDFIIKRLAPKYIENDGAQTPMKGHPVFIAQHACACCCRSCLKKWHGIEKNRELKDNEVNYIVSLIMEWIRLEYKNNK